MAMPDANETHCIYPPFCNINFFNECHSFPLSECSACSSHGFYATLVCFIALAIFIIVGNGLVIISVLTSNSSGRTKNDHTKISLAIADTLPGISILALSVPHLLLSIKQTPQDIHDSEAKSLNTVAAKVGGVSFLFVYSSTIYHLLFMSVQRFIAVRWPFLYRHQTIKWIRLQLLVIWIFSLLSGSVAVWFTDSFGFTYSSHTFQYLPVFRKREAGIRHDILFLILLFAVPYFAMTIDVLRHMPGHFTTTLALATGLILRSKINDGKKIRRHVISSVNINNRSSAMTRSRRTLKASNQQIVSQKHMHYCTTLGFMQIGFTISIVPLMISLSLFAFEIGGCEDGIFHFLSYYLSLGSSLVNVLIYSARDEQFRTNIKTLPKMLSKKLGILNDAASLRLNVRNHRYAIRRRSNSGVT